MKHRSISALATGEDARKERRDFIAEVLATDMPNEWKAAHIQEFWQASLMLKGINTLQEHNARVMRKMEEA